MGFIDMGGARGNVDDACVGNVLLSIAILVDGRFVVAIPANEILGGQLGFARN